MAWEQKKEKPRTHSHESMAKNNKQQRNIGQTDSSEDWCRHFYTGTKENLRGIKRKGGENYTLPQIAT